MTPKQRRASKHFFDILGGHRFQSGKRATYTTIICDRVRFKMGYSVFTTKVAIESRSMQKVLKHFIDGFKVGVDDTVRGEKVQQMSEQVLTQRPWWIG